MRQETPECLANAFAQISPCIPKMGEHWVNPDSLPTKPLYNVYKGRLIAIDHADIGFQPPGHKGFEGLHCDLHFYLVTDAEVREITCG